MRAETVSAYSNVIPRVRDKDGNPVPRRFAFSPPVLTHDAEALLEAGTIAQRSPEEAKRLLPWLLCWNAAAAAENVKRLRHDLAESLNERNDVLRRALAELQEPLRQARADETAKSAELAGLLAELGLPFDPSMTAIAISSDTPSSLMELAGEHGLPLPAEKRSALDSWLHKIVAVFGGGTVFGISLGLLMDKIELASLQRELPMILLFAIFGIAIMFMVGSCLTPLSESVGGWIYRLGTQAGSRQPWLYRLYLLMLAGLAVVFVVIESRVEQIGLFKGLVEADSLTSMKLTKLELGFVALTLSLPVVASYVCLGLTQGEYKANIARLKHLQANGREMIQRDPRYASACRLLPELQLARLARLELESLADRTASQIRESFTVEELYRLEDQEMDAAGLSFAAEQALRGEASGQEPGGGAAEASRQTERLSWWTRLRRVWT